MNLKRAIQVAQLKLLVAGRYSLVYQKAQRPGVPERASEDHVLRLHRGQGAGKQRYSGLVSSRARDYEGLLGLAVSLAVASARRPTRRPMRTVRLACSA